MEEDNSKEIKKDPYAALRLPEFRAFLSFRFLLTFGYQMQGYIMAWYIFHLTKDPLALGLIGLSEAIPSLCVSLYGGYVADKSVKTKLLRWIVAAMFTFSAGIFVVTLPALSTTFSTNDILWMMYIMIFFIGIARGFLSPTVSALAGQIVPRELYSNSSTWGSTGWQVATIVGPATGGFIYAYAGISVTFAVILFFIAAAFLCVTFIKDRPPQFIPKESIMKSLSEGVKFVFNSRMLLGALSLDLLSVFFGGAVALLPIVATEVLHVGPEQGAMLKSATAIGAVLTMLAMSKYSPMNKPWRNLLIAVFGFGLSIIAYGFSRNFYLSLFCLFCEGAFDSVSVIIRQTIVQLLTPDEMRGRVSAVNSMFVGSSNEIGEFESGLTARLMGTVRAIIFGGSMTLIVVITTYFKTKKLIPLSLNEIHPPDQPKPAT